MRVLFIASTKGLFSQSNSYNGGGWIGSLQAHLRFFPNIHIGFVFKDTQDIWKEEREATTYYSIIECRMNMLQKLKYYHGGYKRANSDSTIRRIKMIIDDFKPDLVHVFGTESEFGLISSETNVPCVIHIQGVLQAIYNSYFPSDFDLNSSMTSSFFRERIINNGIGFNYSKMKLDVIREKRIFRSNSYFIGRTKWDQSIVSFLNPDSTYFHVDEILRPAFYQSSKWSFSPNGKLTLVSTISDTIYKGYDVILKVAQLFKSQNVDFSWNIIGVNANSSSLKVIEQKLGLDHDRLNIQLMGVLGPNEMIDVFQRSSIFVHTSYIDNSPNSLCEAQYVGIPTIATNVGGVSSIMNENLEYMVPANEPLFLAAKILNLYQTLQNGTYVNPFYALAHERHNPELITQKLIHIYQTIIENR